jgi:universal stress protein A
MTPTIVLASRLAEEETHTATAALRLAERLGAELVLVYVAVELETAGQLQATLGTGAAAATGAMLAEIEAEMAAFARRCFGDRPVRMRVEEGEVPERLAQVAESEGADYLVIGTEGRTGLRRVVLGSTSEAIIRHAPCPVLVVPPHHP